jgi:hypothetical protein
MINNLIQKWAILIESLSSCAIENNKLAIKTLNEIKDKTITKQIEIIYKNHPYLKK